MIILQSSCMLNKPDNILPFVIIDIDTNATMRDIYQQNIHKSCLKRKKSASGLHAAAQNLPECLSDILSESALEAVHPCESLATVLCVVFLGL